MINDDGLIWINTRYKIYVFVFLALCNDTLQLDDKHKSIEICYPWSRYSIFLLLNFYNNILRKIL